MMRARHHRGLARLALNEAGAALVEFSLLAPFLLTLALGMFEFGRLLYQYQLVVEGLRDAGRYIARLDPTLDSSKQAAKNLAVTGTIDGTGEERVAGWIVDDITIDEPVLADESTTDYRGTPYVVRIETTFSYADLGFLSVLGLSAISVSASHEQRVIDRAEDIVAEEGGG
jgi:hypothetical protein